LDIATWLQGLGLQRYEQAFRDNAIDMAVLPELTAEDLKDMGVRLAATAASCLLQLLLCAASIARSIQQRTKSCPLLSGDK
jgi:hypothetical protein